MAGKVFNESEASILQEIILNRRDVRGNKFLPEEITETDLEKILFAALNAPSVGFSQPWEFVVIKDQETRKQIKDSFEIENSFAKDCFDGEKKEKYIKLKLEGILESPLNIAVFYKPSDGVVLGQTTMKEAGLYSVVCAIQNMWLMGRVLNIGIGWVSILDPEKVKSILNAPAQNTLIAYLCVGYVKEFLEKPELETLQWEKRKELERVLVFEKYK